MLRRVRIEVEEETAEACVEALWKYEHALVQQEARRYRHSWPITITAAPVKREGRADEPPPEIEMANLEEEEYPTPDQPWKDTVEERHWFNEKLGRELHEEVIEYDESLPGYRGRRVVSFVRIDSRSGAYFEISGQPEGFSWGTATGASEND